MIQRGFQSATTLKGVLCAMEQATVVIELSASHITVQGGNDTPMAEIATHLPQLHALTSPALGGG